MFSFLSGTPTPKKSPKRRTPTPKKSPKRRTPPKKRTSPKSTYTISESPQLSEDYIFNIIDKTCIHENVVEGVHPARHHHLRSPALELEGRQVHRRQRGAEVEEDRRQHSRICLLRSCNVERNDTGWN